MNLCVFKFFLVPVTTFSSDTIRFVPNFCVVLAGDFAASLLLNASVLEKPTFSRGFYHKSEASSTLPICGFQSSSASG